MSESAAEREEIFVVIAEQYECGSLHSSWPAGWTRDEKLADAYAEHLQKQGKFKYRPECFAVTIEEVLPEDLEETSP